MPTSLTITLGHPLGAVTLLSNDAASDVSGEVVTESVDSLSAAGIFQQEMQQAQGILEQQQQEVVHTLSVLEDLVTKLGRFYDEALISHRTEIAGLAVEIARKILMQKVHDGDYRIEEIVQEALKKAPMQQEVVVHLNPKDLEACQALPAIREGALAELKWVGDATVGLAECYLETPKGVVKSFLDEHIDKIRIALENVN